MTLGEKITYLRTAQKMSQEQLAELLSVSRQSISKWEMEQALPQIDKVLQLCKLFSITCDDLLLESIDIVSPQQISNEDILPVKNKYFGTDGFRGEANITLTSMHAYQVGRFLGWYFSSPLSGCNKRISPENRYRKRYPKIQLYSGILTGSRDYRFRC